MQNNSALEKETKIFLNPCKTRNELKAWIKRYLGLELPDVTVSRYSDTNPLDVIWQVYDICVNTNNPNNIQELLFVAGRGSGKCVVKGTKILTRTGIKNIEDISIGDIVFTGWDWKPVKDFFDEGIKPGVEINTTIGKNLSAWSLTGSLNHRIQAVNSSGEITWKFLKDILPGDFVYRSSKKHFEVDANSKDFKQGWIAGNIVGDGHVQLDSKYSKITVCGGDIAQLGYLESLVKEYWGIQASIKKNSANSWNYSFYSKKMCDWFSYLVSGRLAYDKKLKTINHSPNFLAGFISGLMETDGSKDSITLANKELIEQIGNILLAFGVVSSINHKRKKARFSKIAQKEVNYSSCTFKTRLPEYLFPLFNKRDSFKKFADSMNEQHRFPSVILRNIGEYIKNKYQVSNGWITVDGKRIRSTIPFSKELWGKSKDKHSYRHKILAIRQWLIDLNDEKADYLSFVADGYFEKVSQVSFKDAYFYDLEIQDTHAYWSNGFISHNTLGMAIAELMILLHDKREVVHVGAIQNQAERCYSYQKNFLFNKKIKPLVMRADLPEDQRILEKANMSKSVFNVDREKLTLEVIPCTLKACLTSDNDLLLSDNSVKKLKEVVPGDVLQSPLGPTKVLENKPLLKECIMVELEDGRIIKGSKDHRVWTTRGWVELQNLTEQDEIL